jgi:UDP-GlcNAc:undecaprenyl-phosphate GlcNAc-1-phosphate transferase
MYSILFLAATAFTCCLILTPLVERGSRRLGLLDRPNAPRKVHLSPVPRTGGVAIVCSVLAAIGLLLLSPLKGAETIDLPLALNLAPAVGTIFLLGVIDDVVGLSAWGKLPGQVAAAYLAYVGGVQIASVAAWPLPEWASLGITILWLIACANAFNLIDGVDGLAAGIGFVATFTILAAALIGNNAPLALATAPLLGALLAFLRYNFNPASIFLGDSGSLTIGFLLGCFGAIWSQKSATLIGLAAPLMALAVPLLDTGAAVLRRFLRHHRILSGDRNHVHHRLLDRGFSARQVALMIYAACAVAAAFSLLATVPGNRYSNLLLIAFCVIAWIAVQLAGYVEFDAARHLVLNGTFRHILNARLFVDTVDRKLATAETNDDYWTILRDVGEEFGCAQVRLALRGCVYEQRVSKREGEPCCTIRISLSDEEYVNFKYSADASARHAVAISAIVELLRRSLSRHVPRVAARPVISRADAAAAVGGTASWEVDMATTEGAQVYFQQRSQL